MKLPGPVSPCTSTTGQPSSSGTLARNHAQASVITGTPPPAAAYCCSHSAISSSTWSESAPGGPSSGRSSADGIEAVQRRELVHELPGDRLLRRGVGDLREATVAGDALHHEGGEVGVHRDELGDAHRRGSERAVHRGFPPEAVERRRLRAEARIRAQPELARRPVRQVARPPRSPPARPRRCSG